MGIVKIPISIRHRRGKSCKVHVALLGRPLGKKDAGFQKVGPEPKGGYDLLAHPEGVVRLGGGLEERTPQIGAKRV